SSPLNHQDTERCSAFSVCLCGYKNSNAQVKPSSRVVPIPAMPSPSMADHLLSTRRLQIYLPLLIPCGMVQTTKIPAPYRRDEAESPAVPPHLTDRRCGCQAHTLLSRSARRRSCSTSLSSQQCCTLVPYWFFGLCWVRILLALQSLCNEPHQYFADAAIRHEAIDTLVAHSVSCLGQLWLRLWSWFHAYIGCRPNPITGDC